MVSYPPFLLWPPNPKLSREQRTPGSGAPNTKLVSVYFNCPHTEPVPTCDRDNLSPPEPPPPHLWLYPSPNKGVSQQLAPHRCPQPTVDGCSGQQWLLLCCLPGNTEQAGGGKSDGAQGGRCAPGTFPCFPLAGSQHLPAQEAASSTPPSSRYPQEQGRMQFALEARNPQTHVLHALLSQLVVLQAQPSCHLPKASPRLAGTQEPLPVPTKRSLSSTATSKPFSALARIQLYCTFCKVNSQITSGLAAEREGSPAPAQRLRCPSESQCRQDRLSRQGSVPGLCHPQSLQGGRRSQWDGGAFPLQLQAKALQAGLGCRWAASAG